MAAIEYPQLGLYYDDNFAVIIVQRTLDALDRQMYAYENTWSI